MINPIKTGNRILSQFATGKILLKRWRTQEKGKGEKGLDERRGTVERRINIDVSYSE